jgi:hypothetical protein
MSKWAMILDTLLLPASLSRLTGACDLVPLTQSIRSAFRILIQSRMLRCTLNGLQA